MSAAPTRPTALPTAVDAPIQSASTAAAVISVSCPLRLDQARAHLVATCDALSGWYARRTGEGRGYIADGHEAIRLIDAASHQLHGVRAALVGEIRADEDERAARVDCLLAECRARQGGDLPDNDQRPWDGGMA